MRHLGIWSDQTTYVSGDIVRYAYDGTRLASWIATDSNRGVMPTSTSQSWGLVAVDGIAGKDGSDGATGIQGLQGPQGLRGIQGQRGFQGVAGVVYTGEYSPAKIYSFQQAVSYSGAVYVALDTVDKNTPPPDGNWVLYPGFSHAAELTQGSVAVMITTGEDFSSGTITGANSYEISLSQHRVVCSGSSLEILSGSYIKTFSGTIAVKVPTGWSPSELLISASGTAEVSSDDTGWEITSSSAQSPITIVFVGVRATS